MAKKARKATRTKERARLVEEARRVVLPPHADVCVVGGGAAGLVAAIAAAEKGARVVVLERELACGRTILATGNGRCNMANRDLDARLYNNPDFVRAVCGKSWLEDVRRFFLDAGLLWVEEAGGRLYPLSRQAASVREVLMDRARRSGVVLAPGREVVGISRGDDGFELCVEERHSPTSGSLILLGASRVVVATGGATPMSFVRELGLRTTPLVPLLCPLACEGHGLSALDGRRVWANARLLRDGHEVAGEAGEVLFRTYGVSGIVVFNLSRHARAGDVLCLDLLPTVDADIAVGLSTHTLAGIMDPVIAEILTRETGDMKKAVHLAKGLRLQVTGLRQADGAQVHRGGLLCDQFDFRTLGAHEVPGLFACGEALDVDGPCGGYNLAWAWKSGMVAGAGAAAGSEAGAGTVAPETADGVHSSAPSGCATKPSCGPVATGGGAL